MSVDLFASRNNNKLSRYVSRRPDPEAYAIDAFSLPWANDVFYMFPPFSLIGRILQKVQEEGTEAVIVAPIWTTQSWWPSLLSLICGKCYQVQRTRQHLYLPHDPDREYPIKKDEPGCFLHIRQELKNRGIQQGARDLILRSWRDGTKQKYNVYINQWFEFCKSKSIDPFHPELRFILMFLTELYTKGLKYNSINVARSLSSFLKYVET